MLIDTLKAQERLTQEFGFDERRAKGVVELFSSAEQRVATGDDLASLEGRLDARMDTLEARMAASEERMGARMDTLEARMAASEERMGARMDTLEARMDTLEAHLSRKLYAVAFVVITVLGALNFFT